MNDNAPLGPAYGIIYGEAARRAVWLALLDAWLWLT